MNFNNRIRPRLVIDFRAFATLANVADAAELKKHGVEDIVENDPELATAIKEIEAESRSAAIRAAAIGIVTLKKASDEFITSVVDELRAVRKMERELLAKIAAVNKAKAFATETRNYLPLIDTITNEVPREFYDLLDAIKSWEPAAVAAPEVPKE